MQVLDDLRAGFVDVKVFQLAPELVQVDTTARGNFAGKFGFWYRPLNSDDIIPFLRHVDVGKAFLKTHGLVQLICWCFIWVLIFHVSPLRCPENYWVHVIVSLKQDASTLRMLSEFWRVNPTRGVTMLSCSLSLSFNNIRTNNKHSRRIFQRKLQVGAPASFKKFLRNTQKIHNSRKENKTTTNTSSRYHNITCYQIKDRDCCMKYFLGIESIFFLLQKEGQGWGV